MKQRTGEGVIAFLAGAMAVVMIVMFIDEAGATGSSNRDNVDVEQHQGQQQGQQQGQGQEQTATGGQAESSSNSSASNDGVSVGGDSVENNSSNIVFVPNNNTEGCLRIFGITLGKNDEGAFGIGWPIRSAACDYGQAADDAFAAGERELGWFWNCHKKALYKPFVVKSKSTDRGQERDAAISACHTRAVGNVTNLATIEKLRADLEFVNNERRIERANCEESKDRIVAGCYDAK